VWREHEGSSPAQGTPDQRSVYSFYAIDHLLDQLRRHEDAWRGFFFRIGQQPLTFYYEDIAGDLDGSLGRLLDALAIERPHEPIVAGNGMARQSDELSESWVQSYLEDVSRR
jgi:LPS sulfotransferase NodH